MPNLHTFTKTQLEQANLHVNSRYVFNWPGMFDGVTNSIESDKTLGAAIVQNVELGGVEHAELSLSIDGHTIPVLGTPKLATTMSMTLMLDNSIVDGTYGKLLDMMYLSDDLGTNIGLDRRTRRLDASGIVDSGVVADLYLINTKYKSAGINSKMDDIAANPSIRLYYPRVKRVSGLSFDSTTADVSKCSLDLVFAWFERNPKNKVVYYAKQ